MSPSREIVPLYAADISTFCKHLRAQLVARSGVAPSHLSLLNMLARSAGHRNYQSLREAPLPVSHPASSSQPIAAPAAPAMPVASPRIQIQGEPGMGRTLRRAVGQFDVDGRLTRWPAQFAVQQLMLWGLWMRLPSRRAMEEREVNRYLDRFHTFGDAATLRRELVNAGFLTRKRDGSDYRRVAKTPSEEAREFLRVLLAHLRADARPAH